MSDTEFDVNSVFSKGFSYDANGNRTSDPARGITSITYDYYNQPVKFTFSDGSTLTNYYRSDGTYYGRNESEAIISTVSTGSTRPKVYKNSMYINKGDFVFPNTVPNRLYIEGGYVDIDFEHSKSTYYYYIHDNQGSVRAVVDENGTLVQATDYSAYGVPSSRFVSTTSDKHLHLGLEWQPMKGIYGYYNNARFRDAILAGTFYQQDPLAEKYYLYTPYHYAAGNPCKYIDQDGMEVDIEYRTGFLGLGGGKILKYDNGNLYNNDGSAYVGTVKGFLKKTVTALGLLTQTKEGASIVSELQSSDNVFTIKSGTTNEFKPNNSLKAGANLTEVQAATGNILGSTGSGGIISWNPSSTKGGFDLSGGTNRPAYISLGHEMAHGSDANQGLLHFSSDYTNSVSGVQYQSTSQGLLKSEWRAVYRENLIRGQARVPLRTNYGIDMSTGTAFPAQPRLLDATNRPLNYP